MNFLKVDEKKCRSDGICALVCPRRLILMDQTKKYPAAIPGAEEMCILCGHCVSVCPHGALSLEQISVDQCVSLEKGWNLTPRQVEQLLKGRRSIRAYAVELVAKETLEKIMETVRYAPSGINRQPLRWIIVHDSAKVSQIAKSVIEWMKNLIREEIPLSQSLRMQDLISAWERGEDVICRGAPHLIFSYGLKEDMTAPQAATIALTFLDLAATSFGLGTCWAGYVQTAVNAYPPLQEMIGLNRRCACFGAMMIGYPKVSYRRIPPRNKAHILWR